MTKNKILIIVITFLLFLCLVKTETKAFPNNEFITGGVNFIDPDNIQFIPGNYSKEGTIKTIAPFKIVWGEEYYICSIMFNDINFGGATVTEYDGVKTEIKKSELNAFWVNNYISFKVSNDTFYLSFEIEVKLNNTSNISLYDISNYVMIKSKAIPKDNFKDYALTYPDRLEYQTPTGFEGLILLKDGYTFNSYMSHPVTMFAINNNIVVYDKNDGKISYKKHIVKKTYDEELIIPGDYFITYQATNSNKVTSEITINIKIIDDIFPVITGSNYFQTKNTEPLNIDDIKKTLLASDNFDGDLTNKIFIKSNNYDVNKNKIGEYVIVFGVNDTAGNLTTYPVTISVNQGDYTPPVIVGEDIIYTDVNNELNDGDITSLYKADDNQDGDISNKIVITKNEYKYNTSKRGTYLVTLSVTDEAGNEATKTITIVNMETEGPVFLLNPVFVEVDKRDLFSSFEEIIDYLKTTNVIEDDEYVMIYDDYTLNQTNVGEHLIQLKKVNTEDEINIVMQVKEKNEEKPSFFGRIGNLFKNLWRSIKSFFSSIFS